jgi:HEAT repeat protein
VLFMEAQVVWYFTLMQFWTFVGDLFDARQSKRLFPLLAIGGPVGMILVWLVNGRLVRSFGTESLLLVWAVLILVATVLAGLTYRRFRNVEPAAPPDLTAGGRPKTSEWEKIKGGLAEVGREPLLRSVAGYILLLWTVYAIVDFCFNKTMRARYPDPAQLTTFFGVFFGVQGVLCLGIQMFFTRPVIARLGVGTTIKFHPGFLLAGTAWMSLKYGYPSVLATKLGDASMLYTFSDSSYQLLYNPVPPERRARVRGFIEGYIRPLSLAAAGVLVLLGNRYLKPLHFLGKAIPTGQQLAWGAVVVAGVWFIVASTSKKGYIRALLHNLQARNPAVRQAAAAALNKVRVEDSLGVLAEALGSANPDRVVAAVQLLETFCTADAARTIAGLLAHPDARVRSTAASALGRLAAKEYSERMLPLLDDPDARVRSNAIEALAASHDPALAAQLRPRLQDSAPRARVNTIVALAALEGAAAVAEWLPFIRQLAEGNVQERSAAAFALGRLPLDESMDTLAKLLADPELGIRCEAARALGRIGTPRAIPALVGALAGLAELRHRARHALVKIARRHDEEIHRQLAQQALETRQPVIRSELADTLGRLKDPQVLDTLVELLKDPEWRVKWKTLKSFERLAKHTTLPESARAALFEYAHGELVSFSESLRISQALFPHPQGEPEILLAQALEEDRLNIEERVFRMLGVLCGKQQMKMIFEKIQSGDARQRADALEALDSLAPKQIGRQVLELLEPAPVSRAPQGPAGDGLGALARHRKPWVRASTAFYLGSHNGDAASLLAGLLADPDPLVRETALYAGWKALGAAWQPRVQEAAGSSDALLGRCARRILAEQTSGSAAAWSAKERGEPMMLTVEKVLYLKAAPVFAGLEGEELAALADIALEKDSSPGEVFFEEGQLAHHLYIIVSGKVEIFRRVGSSERPLAVLGPRECFGEMAILDDEPRSASIRALEPTVVLKIDRESFREFIQERPQIAFAIFKILSGRLRSKNMESETLPAYEVSRNIA